MGIDRMERRSVMGTMREIDLVQAPAACCMPLASTGMSKEEAETTARVFKALADPHRVPSSGCLSPP